MDILERFINHANVGKIIVVANVYGQTEHYICPPEQMQVEFFNEHEMNDIKNSLRNENYDFIAYYDEHRFIRSIEDREINISDNDLVFNLARNGHGVSKKSLIPTYCDYHGIKYTGSCGYSCSLARNKQHVSNLLLFNRLHGLKSWVYCGYWQGNIYPEENIEVIVKPLFESASKGVKNDCIVNTSNQFFAQIVQQKYRELNTPLIIQQFVHGYECKVPVFVLDKITALDPVGVCIDNQKFLDSRIITQDLSFHYSYSNYLLPDYFPPKVIKEVKESAERIFELLGMENYGRIDCRITQNGDFYFYDFATMPYFIQHSELFYIFDRMGYSQGKLFNLIFNSALETKYHYNV